MTNALFDIHDISSRFGYTDLARGRQYWNEGRVEKFVMRAEDGYLEISSEVSGTRSRPYKIRIQVQRNEKNGKAKIQASCSCPVGHMCKHAAATILEALEQMKLRGLPDVIVLPLPKQTLEDKIAGWLDTLAQESETAQKEETQDHIIYILESHPDAVRPKETKVKIVVANALKQGGYSRPRGYSVSQLRGNAPRFVTAEDAAIGGLLGSGASHYYPDHSAVRLPEDQDTAGLLLKRIVGTGRAFLHELKGEPLRAGARRSGRLGWKLRMNGNQSPAILIDGEGDAPFFILSGATPWYVDMATREAGPVDIPATRLLVKRFLEGPSLRASDIDAAVEKLSTHSLAGVIAPPQKIQIERREAVPPVPCLRLVQFSTDVNSARGWDDIDRIHHAALLHFDYDGRAVDPFLSQPELRRQEGEKLVVTPRHERSEQEYRDKIEKELGLMPMFFPPDAASLLEAPQKRLCLHFPPDTQERGQWLDFLHHQVPQLRAQGWRVDIDDDFTEKFRIAVPDNDGIEADMRAEEGGAWWFSLDLGILVEGQRVPLLPLLVQAVRHLRGTDAAQALESLARNGVIYADLADGRAIAIPFDRVRDILATLIELFDREPLNPDGTLRVSLDLAAAFARIEAATRMRWLGGERLRALVERLKNFSGIAKVKPPKSLKANLRDYQKEGLGWLQFLREHDLGGILADDMGLGKTVQTLAHILIEKDAGRLDRPCLVICPTSLIPNWQAEAARFAPGLKVLSLHGKDRAERFGDILKSDIVLTTYPLLPRDAEHILPVDWHMTVLDEAQMIKNPTAKATQLVCELKARHRLCLTGTPIENHVGEAWSHFAFLLPGMLGDAKRFARLFRTPIEKHGDGARQALLARRLKPFILRRTKAEVAKELPPKTEILHHVEMGGTQRDLYETLRLTMHQKVQQAVAEKGLNRSHIIILDALLKLRQACCDPRLVRLNAVKKAKNSAKLESLLDMLPEMVEEGRRVLLFSQFTSMLDLIKPELDKAGIPFVELRGNTKDRKTPLARFQAGEVPLFLISLKAGGTGLNLTAADTVIHYDPWWNPAVEAQATDRAHRIGQDKPVFVYKMIAKGTVEERIMEMQNKKRAIAAAILDESGSSAASITQSDLDFLFREAA